MQKPTRTADLAARWGVFAPVAFLACTEIVNGSFFWNANREVTSVERGKYSALLSLSVVNKIVNNLAKQLGQRPCPAAEFLLRPLCATDACFAL
jgi:hypothetical protein